MNLWKIAFRLGKLEHNTSRTVFLFILLSYASYVWKTYGNPVLIIDTAAWLNSLDTTDWLLRITMILWAMYWIFHTLEKKAFHAAPK